MKVIKYSSKIYSDRKFIHVESTENSKLFIELGKRVGIKTTKRTQRGIISKLYLSELNQDFRINQIKLNGLQINEGDLTYYL